MTEKKKREPKPWDYIPPSRIKREQAARNREERARKRQESDNEWKRRHEFKNYGIEGVQGRDAYAKVQGKMRYTIHATDRRGNPVGLGGAFGYENNRKMRKKMHDRPIWIKFRTSKHRMEKLDKAK